MAKPRLSVKGRGINGGDPAGLPDGEETVYAAKALDGVPAVR